MHPDFETLREDYLRALRPVVADALRWWDAHCPYPHTEPRPFAARTPFHQRWTAGPAAHPRVLAVFREYWFRADALNDRLEDEARAAAAADQPEGEAAWGTDAPPPDLPRVLPMDLLVNDLETVAPDLHEVMQGLVYVPIGNDPLHQTAC